MAYTYGKTEGVIYGLHDISKLDKQPHILKVERLHSNNSTSTVTKITFSFHSLPDKIRIESHWFQAHITTSVNRRLGTGILKTENRSLQVISSKQMNFESSFERCRRLNVTEFTPGGIPDSRGKHKKNPQWGTAD